jgi:hypothetical protein
MIHLLRFRITKLAVDKEVKDYKVMRADVIIVCCQHVLFAHQTVRTASVLRLTYAAHADEALLSSFLLCQHVLFAHQTV